MLKFETNDKYYVVELNIDLLGDLVVVCHYGSRHTKHSQALLHRSLVNQNLLILLLPQFVESNHYLC